MNDQHKKLLELIDDIEARQNALTKELNDVRLAMEQLLEKEEDTQQVSSMPSIPPLEESSFSPPPLPASSTTVKELPEEKPKEKRNIESFLGGNLLSKVGIIVMIIGVALGFKFAIDNNLISHAMRLFAGAISGLAFAYTAYRLNKKYRTYSAVLFGGGMAILFFTVFYGCSVYNIIHPIIAYIFITLLLTACVWVASKYNQKWIALLGLIGSYYVPFMVGDFSHQPIWNIWYVILTNIGVVYISFTKRWKLVYITAFILSSTLMVFFSFLHKSAGIFGTLSALSINYFSFLVISIAVQLREKDFAPKESLMLFIGNTGIYFTIGFFYIKEFAELVSIEKYQTLFAIFIGIVNILIGFAIEKKSKERSTCVNLLYGMGITMLGIATPIWFGGNSLFLLWTAEATLLFCIGRVTNTKVLEKMAYPFILVSLISFAFQNEGIQEYFTWYTNSSVKTILHHGGYYNLILAVGLAFMFVVNYKYPYKHQPFSAQKILDRTLPYLTLFVLFFSFYAPIQIHWQIKILTAETNLLGSTSLPQQAFLWSMNYSILFGLLLVILNQFIFRSKVFSTNNLAFLFLIGFMHLTASTTVILSLGEHLKEHQLIILLSILSTFILCSSFVFYRKNKKLKKAIRTASHIAIHTGILSVLYIILSLGSIHYQLSAFSVLLTILIGLYAVMLIVLGIWKKQKHLRLFSIVLFGVLFVRLIFVNILTLSGGMKTLVFIILGALMLLVSFLYNKYKHIILAPDVEDQEEESNTN